MHITDEALHQLLEMAEAATPRPWHLRHLDDTHAMNLTGISTVPDTGRGERWPDFDSAEMVAATLVQEPRYVCVADGKWDQNAEYIIAAENLVPDLVREILDLRKKVSSRSHLEL
jgi:hypothetical protein